MSKLRRSIKRRRQLVRHLKRKIRAAVRQSILSMTFIPYTDDGLERITFQLRQMLGENGQVIGAEVQGGNITATVEFKGTIPNVQINGTVTV